MFDAADERPRGSADLYTFEFWAPEGTIGGHLALWRWPAAGVGCYATAFFRAGEPVVALYDEFPLKATLELRGQGLWAEHNLEQPFAHWSVGLEAFALALDDPAEDRGERIALGYDLDWECEPSQCSLLDDGYEQPATVRGEVLLGMNAYELDGFGWRSHVGLNAVPSTTRRRHGMGAGTLLWSVADATRQPGDDALGWSRSVTPAGWLDKAMFVRPDGCVGFTETWFCAVLPLR